VAARKCAVAGPWDNEPDEWHGEFHGLRVRAVRHRELGSWLGYVLLPRGHPQYGVGYEQISADGATYAEHGAHQDNLELMEKALRDDDVWEVDFDCGHGWDYQPGMAGFMGLDLGTKIERYKTLEYVKQRLEKMAAQLAGKKAIRSDHGLDVKSGPVQSS